MHREIIEYPNTAKAKAALLRFRENPDVTNIELLGDNRVLRVTMEIEPVDSGTEIGELVHDEHPGAFFEEPVEDLIGEPTAGDPEEAQTAEEPVEETNDTIDLTDLDRKGLIAFAKDQGLDVKIPNNTPLVKEQAKVAEALAAKKESE